MNRKLRCTDWGDAPNVSNYAWWLPDHYGNILSYYRLVNTLVGLPNRKETYVEREISFGEEINISEANGSLMIGKGKFMMFLMILSVVRFIGIMHFKEGYERKLSVVLFVFLVMVEECGQLA